MLVDILAKDRAHVLAELERRATTTDAPAVGRRERLDVYLGELVAALLRGHADEEPPTAAPTIDPVLERQERDLLRQLALEALARQRDTANACEDKLVVSSWSALSERRLLREQNQRLQRRIDLLFKLTTLAGTLELDELLPALARLWLPELADWCAVDVPQERAPRRIYVASGDPGKAALAAELQRFVPWRERAGWQQLLAGRSLLFVEVTDDVLRANAENQEHFEVARSVGYRSLIAVPLRLSDATIAVITFATSGESDRRYGPDDLALAEELARRAGFIIDRARLHAQLKASDARMRVAVAIARTAVFEQDRELRYRWAYNLPSGNDDVIGKTHLDVFPPELAEKLTTLKQHVIETGEPMRGEVRGTGRGAASVTTVAVDPLRDDSGAIVGVIGASTDITEEKRVQEELARAVTFREQLMGILGHDLRNPLGAITMADGLLLQGQELSPTARDQLLRIRRAAARMQEMIGTLLDFTRARFVGELPVAPVPADLGKIAHGVVDELRVAWPDHEVRLEVQGDARGRWDPARMAQVISNLVGNAISYGDPEQPVRVHLRGVGEAVVLQIENLGAPIPPELMPVLFEPFRRGEPHDRSPRGLGLGLYIVRQIVTAHAGTIDVASTAEQGTTFTVRLPR